LAAKAFRSDLALLGLALVEGCLLSVLLLTPRPFHMLAVEIEAGEL